MPDRREVAPIPMKHDQMRILKADFEVQFIPLLIFSAVRAKAAVAGMPPITPDSTFMWARMKGIKGNKE